jgi:uncharacterized protein (DUF2225 family)
MKRIMISLFFVMFFALIANTTTWAPVKKKCPLCKVSHEYMQVGSFGSYIYAWPSKLQLVFWPSTDQYSLYCCVSCKFTAFMWDFDSIPSTKTSDLKAMLKEVSFDSKYKKYTDIPVSQRITIAEKVYDILGKTKDEQCWFYRVAAWHYDENDEEYAAFSARNKAITIALNILLESNGERDKETHFILASMYYYTYNYDMASTYISQSLNTAYSDSRLSEIEIKNYSDYLIDLCKELSEKIKELKKE